MRSRASRQRAAAARRGEEALLERRPVLLDVTCRQRGRHYVCAVRTVKLDHRGLPVPVAVNPQRVMARVRELYRPVGQEMRAGQVHFLSARPIGVYDNLGYKWPGSPEEYVDRVELGRTGVVRLHPADVDAVLNAYSRWWCDSKVGWCYGPERRVRLRTPSIRGGRVCVVPIVRPSMFSSAHATLSQMPGERCFVLSVQPDLFKKYLAAGRGNLRRRLAPLIAHELTHALDTGHAQGAYFDKPTEINAYLQQARTEMMNLPLHERLAMKRPMSFVMASPTARELMKQWEGKPAQRRLLRVAAGAYEETQAASAAQRSGARLAEQERTAREIQRAFNLPRKLYPLPGEPMAEFLRRARA